MLKKYLDSLTSDTLYVSCFLLVYLTETFIGSENWLDVYGCDGNTMEKVDPPRCPYHCPTILTDAHRCCQTELVSVSFDQGKSSARMPVGFIRRSEVLSQQMDPVNHVFNEVVDMNDIAAKTFWHFFDWSYQKNPEIRSLSMQDALSLAWLSERYRINALRNQLSDVFRDQFGKKSWKLDPATLEAICRVDSKDERWLYGMVKMLLGTVTAHFGFGKEGTEVWTRIMDKYPDLYRAHFTGSLVCVRPNELLNKGPCYWHRHAKKGSGDSVDCSNSCQLIMQECFPEWMESDANTPSKPPIYTDPDDTCTRPKRQNEAPNRFTLCKKVKVAQTSPGPTTLGSLVED